VTQKSGFFSKVGPTPFLRQKIVFVGSLVGLIILGLACGIPTQNPPREVPRIPPLSTPDRRFPRQPARMNALAFSPDGQWLATGGDDMQVQLWSFSTGEPVRRLSGHFAGITSVAFRPDGRILSSAGRDKTVKLWDASTGKELRTLAAHLGEVRSVAFSADGNILASASADGTVKLWDVATGKEVRSLLGHSDAVNAVAFSPDGITLATASSDNTVRLWNFATGELLRTLGPQKAHVLALDFSPDATTLATGSGTGAAAPPIPFHSSRSAELKFFDPHTGRETYSSPAFFSSITALAFRPDGEVLAVAFISADKASDIDFLETRSHRLRRHFLAHRGFIHSIAFSPDGAWLVSVGSDQAIRAWH